MPLGPVTRPALPHNTHDPTAPCAASRLLRKPTAHQKRCRGAGFSGTSCVVERDRALIHRAPLHRRRWPWAAAAGLVVGNLFLHKPISDVCDALFVRLGRGPYERLMLSAIAAGSIAGGLALLRGRVWALRRPRVLAALLLLAVATVAAQQWMLVSNVELIHFPQFGLLAALLLGAGLAPQPAWIGATACGVLDETYQHLVIYAHVAGTYFDYNDVVLNAIGAAWTVVLAAAGASLNRTDGASRWERALLGALLVGFGVSFWLAPPHVAAVEAFPYWRPALARAATGLDYHVMSASEGLAAVLLIWGLVWTGTGGARGSSTARPSAPAGSAGGACLPAPTGREERDQDPPPSERPMSDSTHQLTDYDPALAVSAIVVNWNGREHLELCLDSLLRQTIGGVEVVLVDNASSDGSVAFVRERFGDAVRVLALAQNLGYSGGLNAGIRAARGRYLLALNNDTEVAPDALATLVAAADRWPNAGMFQPKIVSFDDRSVLDNVGHLLYADGLSRGRGRLEPDRGQYDREEEIVLPSGCAVLLRRAMLADVGLFDTDLFAYCDDTDLGLRARLMGWRCRAVPAAVVFHKYSAASAAYSPLKAFLVERNRAWVAVKCLPAPLLLASPLFTALRLAAQAWGAVSRRGAAGRFAAVHSPQALVAVLVRAYAAALRGLPNAWRKRRVVQGARRVSAWEMMRWLRQHGMRVREIALKD